MSALIVSAVLSSILGKIDVGGKRRIEDVDADSRIYSTLQEISENMS
jgi:hypothetical protein